MLRPFPQYSAVTDVYGNVACSTYHSMQLTFGLRRTTGLTLNANYTFSRTEDNLAARTGYNFDQDWAVGVNDQPHVFNVIVVYDVPFGGDRPAWAAATPSCARSSVAGRSRGSRSSDRAVRSGRSSVPATCRTMPAPATPTSTQTSPAACASTATTAMATCSAPTPDLHRPQRIRLGAGLHLRQHAAHAGVRSAQPGLLQPGSERSARLHAAAERPGSSWASRSSMSSTPWSSAASTPTSPTPTSAGSARRPTRREWRSSRFAWSSEDHAQAHVSNVRAVALAMGVGVGNLPGVSSRRCHKRRSRRPPGLRQNNDRTMRPLGPDEIPPNLSFYAMDPLYKPGVPLGWSPTRIVRNARSRPRRSTRSNPASVYLSWRLLASDAPTAAFNVYRAAAGGPPAKLNAQPVRRPPTSWTRRRRSIVRTTWWVTPVVNGRELAPSDRVSVPAGAVARPYHAIRLRDDVQSVDRVGIGDLNATAPTTSSSSIPPAGSIPGRRGTEHRHVQDRCLQRPHRRVHVAHRSRLEHQSRHLVLADGRARSRRRRQGRGLPSGPPRTPRHASRASIRAGRSSSTVLSISPSTTGRRARKSTRSTGSSGGRSPIGRIDRAIDRAAT